MSRFARRADREFPIDESSRRRHPLYGQDTRRGDLHDWIAVRDWARQLLALLPGDGLHAGRAQPARAWTLRVPRLPLAGRGLPSRRPR